VGGTCNLRSSPETVNHSIWGDIQKRAYPFLTNFSIKIHELLVNYSIFMLKKELDGLLLQAKSYAEIPAQVREIYRSAELLVVRPHCIMA